MTPEQRLERLERIAGIFVKAGLRERRNRRELDENIKMVISAQIENEDRFARNEDRFAKLAEAHAATETVVKDLAMAHRELTTAQKQTDERLRALIEIVTRNRNGEHE